MANRYWVGGTGSWSATNTANWSATSGGAGGASVPTSSDNVFFNNLSNATAYTVTITAAANCFDFNMTGPLVGNVTWAGSSTLAIYGSMTVAATGVTRTYAAAITFAGTSSELTINCGSALGSGIIFNGTGTWTLANALSTNGVITLTAGTFSTSSSGNYALTCANFISTGSATRAHYWNASTITMPSGGQTLSISGSNFIADAGTSTLIFGGNNNIAINAAGVTFYNISFTHPTLLSIAFQSSFICNNLTFSTRTSAGVTAVTGGGGITVTINGTLSNATSNAAARLFFTSNSLNAKVSLIANAVSLNDCDFRDIDASGSANWSGTRLGDCGGNSGITFATPKTVYYSLAAGGNFNATAWATTSGGTPAVNNFPLPQDTAIINDASSNTSTTITLNVGGSVSYNMPSIDASSRTTALTIAFSNPNSYYGSLILSSAITVSGSSAVTFSGRGSSNVISIINDFPCNVTIANVSGTIALNNNFTHSTNTKIFTLTSGNFNLNSYTATTGLFQATGSRALNLIGAGNFIITGLTGNVWNASNSLFSTTNPALINVSFTGASLSGTTRTINTGFVADNVINYNFSAGAAGSIITLTTNNVVGSINFTGTSSTITNVSLSIYGDIVMGYTATFTAGIANWILNGTGTKSITSNGKMIDFPLNKSGSGTMNIVDTFQMADTRTLTHNAGAIVDNGQTMRMGAYLYATSNSKSFNINSTLTLALSGTIFSGSGTSPSMTGTGIIDCVSSSAKTFTGNNINFSGITLNQGGSGALTISGSNRFYNISNTVEPANITFTGGSTTILSKLSLNGISGNLITIGSTTTTKAIIKKPSSFIMGANSVDGGNNTGLIFAASTSNDYISASYIQAMLTPNNFNLLCK